MRTYEDPLLYSPFDLVTFLRCAYALSSNHLRLVDPGALPERAQDDAMAKLVQCAGLDHEDAYRARLEAEGGRVEIPTTGSLRTARLRR